MWKIQVFVFWQILSYQTWELGGKNPLQLVKGNPEATSHIPQYPSHSKKKILIEKAERGKWDGKAGKEHSNIFIYCYN